MFERDVPVFYTPYLSLPPSWSSGQIPTAIYHNAYTAVFLRAGIFSLYLHSFQKEENNNPRGVGCLEKQKNIYLFVELRNIPWCLLYKQNVAKPPAPQPPLIFPSWLL